MLIGFAHTEVSNISSMHSGHTYQLHTQHRRQNRHQLHHHHHRGQEHEGKFLSLVLSSVGKSKIVKAFRNSVQAVEARDYTTKTSQP